MITPARCPICDTAWHACGPHTEHTPVDTPARTALKEDPTMLAEYEVVINGMPTTALLTPAQAARLGGKKTGAGNPLDKDAARHKGRKPSNKSAD